MVCIGYLLKSDLALAFPAITKHGQEGLLGLSLSWLDGAVEGINKYRGLIVGVFCEGLAVCHEPLIQLAQNLLVAFFVSKFTDDIGEFL